MTSVTTITDWVRATRCPGSYGEYELDPTTLDDAGWYHGIVVCPVCGVTASGNYGSQRTTINVPGHADQHARDADLLRAAAQHSINDGRGPVSMLYLSHDTSPGGIYWARQRASTAFERLDDERVVRLMTLLARYKRLHRLVTEVWPGWVEWNRIHWADNSIDSNQVATDGSDRVRHVQVLAPGGDRCF